METSEVEPPPDADTRDPAAQEDTGRRRDSRTPQADEEVGAASPSVRQRLQRHPIIATATVLVVVAAVIAATVWWLDARHYEASDDAFIDSRAFSVAPEVTGYIVDVPVQDNQKVTEGTVVARIDDRDFRISLEQAEAQVRSAEAGIAANEAQIASQRTQIERAQAQVKQAQAALQFAQQQADRYKQLEQTAGGTVQQAQQTASQLQQQQANLATAQADVDVAQQQTMAVEAQRAGAVAGLAQAQAQRDKARLDLERTTITAAQPGKLVHLTAAKGQYAQPGQALMMVVPEQIWVTANFKETQITDMRPGQPVTLSVDAYPSVEFHGHVDSIQAGSGTAFSLLPAENATGNYVKVVQRVPVKIVFDDLPKDVVLGPGMSVVPSVKVR